MFIYEFMAGVVDTFTGGDAAAEEEEQYDPHEHRKIDKPTSYSETMIHLLKGSVGAGILAMPDAVSRLGVPAGLLGIAVIGIGATYCIHLLIAAQYEVCRRRRRGYMAYARSMREALAAGPKALRRGAVPVARLVDVVLVAWQLGICTIYVIFVAENIKQVFDFYNMVYPLRLHICSQLLPLIVMNLVKNLKLLTPMSTVSNVLTILSLILVFYYLIEDDLTMDREKFETRRPQDVPMFVGTTLFALEAVGVVLALEYNMEHPKRFVGACGLFNVGMLVTMILYAVVGVFGCLKYGSEVRASVTLNLPHHEKKAQAAKMTIALAIFMSFPLQNFVAYNIVWRRVRKRLGEEHRSRAALVDYALRVALVVFPWGLGAAMPRLGPFISLFGAVCLSLLAVVFPGLMDACVWWPGAGQGPAQGQGQAQDQSQGQVQLQGQSQVQVQGQTRRGPSDRVRRGPSDRVRRLRVARDCFIIIVGLLCLAAGCYTSIHEIIESQNEDD